MSMTVDDAATIRAFRHGDDTVFDDVVAEYRLELLRHARRRTPDDATAEDLVQETFVRAYRSFGRLPDDSRVRPWLHQILRNVCIDDSHRRRRELDKLDRITAEASRTAVDGPEETLGLDVDTVALTTAMTALPASHRDAFVQRVVDGLDYDEIAAREGVTEPNARARVSRARAALRRALQGAAAIPLAAYLLVRRPGRHALAAGPADPAAATNGTTAASTANRIATTLAPAVDMATSTAAGTSHTVPLLAKAAVGIGAVATMTFATGPEAPVERPAAVVAEAEAATIDPTPAPATAVAAPAREPSDQAPGGVASAAATPQSLTATTITTAPPGTEPVVNAARAVAAAPVVSSAPETTAPATSTTQAPTTTTTTPPTTVPPTVPQLTGGALTGSVSVNPAGPRLDLSGSITLSVGGASTAGSMSGRLGVGDPDPAGSRRLDGTFTVDVDGATIELRLAGYGTSTQPVEPGVAATSLTMSGVYRASGATGQLATSGSFSGSLQGSTLTVNLSI